MGIFHEKHPGFLKNAYLSDLHPGKLTIFEAQSHVESVDGSEPTIFRGECSGSSR